MPARAIGLFDAIKPPESIEKLKLDNITVEDSAVLPDPLGTGGSRTNRNRPPNDALLIIVESNVESINQIGGLPLGQPFKVKRVANRHVRLLLVASLEIVSICRDGGTDHHGKLTLVEVLGFHVRVLREPPEALQIVFDASVEHSVAV